MSCDICEVTEMLENELCYIMDGSPGELSRACDVEEAKEGLENEL